MHLDRLLGDEQGLGDLAVGLLPARRLLAHAALGGGKRGDALACLRQRPSAPRSDLSAGALEKTNDPVRLYLREMGVVPLLTREGEVAIAKRIERGQLKTQKAIARSPIAVRELLKIGQELEAGKLNIRDTVVFSEQAELTGDEDKAEEYRTWTIEGIQNINKLFKSGLKEWEKLRVEQRAQRGKKSKKVMRLRRRVARMRLEIAQETGRLNLTERARHRIARRHGNR